MIPVGGNARGNSRRSSSAVGSRRATGDVRCERQPTTPLACADWIGMEWIGLDQVGLLAFAPAARFKANCCCRRSNEFHHPRKRRKLGADERTTDARQQCGRVRLPERSAQRSMQKSVRVCYLNGHENII